MDGDLERVTEALHSTLDPRISNATRQQALRYLEETRTQYNAPQYGFSLANDASQSSAVRYYGLQLLEYAVRYRWARYEAEQAEIRDWVIRLSGTITCHDELFFRNKIAQLWVEVAKRCWGEGWMDMDKLLVTLWERADEGLTFKLFVLYVLELLSEDICNREDAAAGLRLEVLGSALNGIMVPEAIYSGSVEARTKGLRYGKEGWLRRVGDFIVLAIRNVRRGNDPLRVAEDAALKAFNAFRPTMVSQPLLLHVHGSFASSLPLRACGRDWWVVPSTYANLISCRHGSV